jgi:hypothetical protein
MKQLLGILGHDITFLNWGVEKFVIQRLGQWPAVCSAIGKVRVTEVKAPKCY